MASKDESMKLTERKKDEKQIKNVKKGKQKLNPISQDEGKKIIEDLYSISKIEKKDLEEIYDSVRYQGFNRQEVLAALMSMNFEKMDLIQIVLSCALRGPVQASKIKLKNGRSLEEIGIYASGGKGSKELTCSKICSATADLAAFFMKQLTVPKRIIKSNLPAWLQFPAAGSIKLPEALRAEHLAFSKEFSVLIRGEFNEQIYDQMKLNSYLEESFKLFDQI
jgi:hypothetical protein